MDTIRSQRRGAFATPWPYAGVALVSVLTSPLLFGATLFLGIIVGMVGALRGAFSKSEPGRIQGVHIFFVGITFLAGPGAYLILVLSNSN
jgi:hypothetical protein